MKEDDSVNDGDSWFQSSAEDGAPAEEIRTPVVTVVKEAATANGSRDDEFPRLYSGTGAEDGAAATRKQKETTTFVEGAATASGGDFRSQRLRRIVYPFVGKPPPLLTAVLPWNREEARTETKQEGKALPGADAAGRGGGRGAPRMNRSWKAVVELADDAVMVNGELTGAPPEIAGVRQRDLVVPSLFMFSSSSKNEKGELIPLHDLGLTLAFKAHNKKKLIGSLSIYFMHLFIFCISFYHYGLEHKQWWSNLIVIGIYNFINCC
ncbi:hypothetical protein PIB30_033197 [Stylosanthes scabra]|uniref:Uncharacterized protein n=1 Tax=Stylosanthes scabra TaxID=79078 RepID=A0ABU6RCJ9_9FABA|nr:hypothetical protein [Stylosanthes scabra]